MACMIHQVSDVCNTRSRRRADQDFLSRSDTRRFHCEAYSLERRCGRDHESCAGFLAKADSRSHYIPIPDSSFFQDDFAETEPGIS
jgi:hypothetical protein